MISARGGFFAAKKQALPRSVGAAQGLHLFYM